MPLSLESLYTLVSGKIESQLGHLLTVAVVGLSRHADRFFKFLLILVEYSLGMTLYVSRTEQKCDSPYSLTQNFFLACAFRNGGVAILLSSLWNLFLMTYAG